MIGNRRRGRIRARHHVVVAYLALFVALGGTAIAAKPLIDSSDVQDESLTGVDVKNDSLTGDDIAEGSLGQVLSSATAGSASTAGDADKLDGIDSAGFLRATGKAADADELDGKDSGAFQTSGWGSRWGGAAFANMATLRSLSIDVGPTARRVLLMANATLESFGSDCVGHIQLVVDGSPQQDMTASAVAMDRGGAYGTASLTTIGLAALSSGTHEIRVQGTHSPGCPDTGVQPFRTGGLHAVVLDN